MSQGELPEILRESFSAMENTPGVGLIFRVVITFSASHRLLKVRRQRHREGSVCTLPFHPGLPCGGRICRLVKSVTIFLYAVLCLVHQSCPTLCDLMACCQPDSSVHGDSPGKRAGVGSLSFSRGSSQPRERTQVSHTRQADSSPTEPPGEPKNTGVVGCPFSRGSS